MAKIQKELSKREYQVITLIALLVLIIGTVFYHFVEHWRWIDSVYFSVITLATVGYGDFAPKTDIGKIFTIFYALVGIGILGAFANSLLKRAAARRERRRSDSRNMLTDPKTHPGY